MLPSSGTGPPRRQRQQPRTIERSPRRPLALPALQLCEDPKVTASVFKSMLEEGRAAGLKGFEQVLRVLRGSRAWSRYCGHCAAGLKGFEQVLERGRREY